MDAPLEPWPSVKEEALSQLEQAYVLALQQPSGESNDALEIAAHYAALKNAPSPPTLTPRSQWQDDLVKQIEDTPLFVTKPSGDDEDEAQIRDTTLRYRCWPRVLVARDDRLAGGACAADDDARCTWSTEDTESFDDDPMVRSSVYQERAATEPWLLSLKPAARRQWYATTGARTLVQGFAGFLERAGEAYSYLTLKNMVFELASKFGPSYTVPVEYVMAMLSVAFYNKSDTELTDTGAAALQALRTRVPTWLLEEVDLRTDSMTTDKLSGLIVRLALQFNETEAQKRDEAAAAPAPRADAAASPAVAVERYVYLHRAGIGFRVARPQYTEPIRLAMPGDTAERNVYVCSTLHDPATSAAAKVGVSKIMHFSSWWSETCFVDPIREEVFLVPRYAQTASADAIRAYFSETSPKYMCLAAVGSALVVKAITLTEHELPRILPLEVRASSAAAGIFETDHELPQWYNRNEDGHGRKEAPFYGDEERAAVSTCEGDPSRLSLADVGTGRARPCRAVSADAARARLRELAAPTSPLASALSDEKKAFALLKVLRAAEQRFAERLFGERATGHRLTYEYLLAYFEWARMHGLRLQLRSWQPKIAQDILAFALYDQCSVGSIFVMYCGCLMTVVQACQLAAARKTQQNLHPTSLPVRDLVAVSDPVAIAHPWTFDSGCMLAVLRMNNFPFIVTAADSLHQTASLEFMTRHGANLEVGVDDAPARAAVDAVDAAYERIREGRDERDLSRIPHAYGRFSGGDGTLPSLSRFAEGNDPAGIVGPAWLFARCGDHWMVGQPLFVASQPELIKGQCPFRVDMVALPNGTAFQAVTNVKAFVQQVRDSFSSVASFKATPFLMWKLAALRTMATLEGYNSVLTGAIDTLRAVGGLEKQTFDDLASLVDGTLSTLWSGQWPAREGMIVACTDARGRIVYVDFHTGLVCVDDAANGRPFRRVLQPLPHGLFLDSGNRILLVFEGALLDLKSFATVLRTRFGGLSVAAAERALGVRRESDTVASTLSQIAFALHEAETAEFSVESVPNQWAWLQPIVESDTADASIYDTLVARTLLCGMTARRPADAARRDQEAAEATAAPGALALAVPVVPALAAWNAIFFSAASEAQRVGFSNDLLRTPSALLFMGAAEGFRRSLDKYGSLKLSSSSGAGASALTDSDDGDERDDEHARSRKALPRGLEAMWTPAGPLGARCHVLGFMVLQLPNRTAVWLDYDHLTRAYGDGPASARWEPHYSSCMLFNTYQRDMRFILDYEVCVHGTSAVMRLMQIRVSQFVERSAEPMPLRLWAVAKVGDAASAASAGVTSVVDRIRATLGTTAGAASAGAGATAAAAMSALGISVLGLSLATPIGWAWFLPAVAGWAVAGAGAGVGTYTLASSAWSNRAALGSGARALASGASAVYQRTLMALGMLRAANVANMEGLAFNRRPLRPLVNPATVAEAASAGGDHATTLAAQRFWANTATFNAALTGPMATEEGVLLSLALSDMRRHGAAFLPDASLARVPSPAAAQAAGASPAHRAVAAVFPTVPDLLLASEEYPGVYLRSRDGRPTGTFARREDITWLSGTPPARVPGDAIVFLRRRPVDENPAVADAPMYAHFEVRTQPARSRRAVDARSTVAWIPAAQVLTREDLMPPIADGGAPPENARPEIDIYLNLNGMVSNIIRSARLRDSAFIPAFSFGSRTLPAGPKPLEAIVASAGMGPQAAARCGAAGAGAAPFTPAMYQFAAVERLTRQCRFQRGAVLCHRMGSGKTITGLLWAMNLPHSQVAYGYADAPASASQVKIGGSGSAELKPVTLVPRSDGVAGTQALDENGNELKAAADGEGMKRVLMKLALYSPSDPRYTRQYVQKPFRFVIVTPRGLSNPWLNDMRQVFKAGTNAEANDTVELPRTDAAAGNVIVNPLAWAQASFHFITYDELATAPYDALNTRIFGTADASKRAHPVAMLCDEAHHLLDLVRLPEQERAQYVREVVGRGVSRVLLCTGTPVQKDWPDFAELINLSAGTVIVPTERSLLLDERDGFGKRSGWATVFGALDSSIGTVNRVSRSAVGSLLRMGANLLSSGAVAEAAPASAAASSGTDVAALARGIADALKEGAGTVSDAFSNAAKAAGTAAAVAPLVAAATAPAAGTAAAVGAAPAIQEALGLGSFATLGQGVTTLLGMGTQALSTLVGTGSNVLLGDNTVSGGQALAGLGAGSLSLLAAGRFSSFALKSFKLLPLAAQAGGSAAVNAASAALWLAQSLPGELASALTAANKKSNALRLDAERLLEKVRFYISFYDYLQHKVSRVRDFPLKLVNKYRVTYTDYQLMLLAAYSAGRGLTATQMRALGMASSEDSLLASFVSAEGGMQYADKLRVLSNLSPHCELFTPVLYRNVPRILLERWAADDGLSPEDAMAAVRAAQADLNNAMTRIRHHLGSPSSTDSESRSVAFPVYMRRDAIVDTSFSASELATRLGVDVSTITASFYVSFDTAKQLMDVFAEWCRKHGRTPTGAIDEWSRRRLTKARDAETSEVDRETALQLFPRGYTDASGAHPPRGKPKRGLKQNDTEYSKELSAWKTEMDLWAAGAFAVIAATMPAAFGARGAVTTLKRVTELEDANLLTAVNMVDLLIKPSFATFLYADGDDAALRSAQEALDSIPETDKSRKDAARAAVANAAAALEAARRTKLAYYMVRAFMHFRAKVQEAREALLRGLSRLDGVKVSKLDRTSTTIGDLRRLLDANVAAARRGILDTGRNLSPERRADIEERVARAKASATGTFDEQTYVLLKYRKGRILDNGRLEEVPLVFVATTSEQLVAYNPPRSAPADSVTTLTTVASAREDMRRRATLSLGYADITASAIQARYVALFRQYVASGALALPPREAGANAGGNEAVQTLAQASLEALFLYDAVYAQRAAGVKASVAAASGVTVEQLRTEFANEVARQTRLAAEAALNDMSSSVMRARALDDMLVTTVVEAERAQARRLLLAGDKYARVLVLTGSSSPGSRDTPAANKPVYMRAPAYGVNVIAGAAAASSPGGADGDGALFGCPKYERVLAQLLALRTSKAGVPVVYSCFDEYGMQTFGAFLTSRGYKYLTLNVYKEEMGTTKEAIAAFKAAKRERDSVIEAANQESRAPAWSSAHSVWLETLLDAILNGAQKRMCAALLLRHQQEWGLTPKQKMQQTTGLAVALSVWRTQVDDGDASPRGELMRHHRACCEQVSSEINTRSPTDNAVLATYTDVIAAFVTQARAVFDDMTKRLQALVDPHDLDLSAHVAFTDATTSVLRRLVTENPIMSMFNALADADLISVLPVLRARADAIKPAAQANSGGASEASAPRRNQFDRSARYSHGTALPAELQESNREGGNDTDGGDTAAASQEAFVLARIVSDTRRSDALASLSAAEREAEIAPATIKRWLQNAANRRQLSWSDTVLPRLTLWIAARLDEEEYSSAKRSLSVYSVDQAVRIIEAIKRDATTEAAFQQEAFETGIWSDSLLLQKPAESLLSSTLNTASELVRTVLFNADDVVETALRVQGARRQNRAERFRARYAKLGYAVRQMARSVGLSLPSGAAVGRVLSNSVEDLSNSVSGFVRGVLGMDLLQSSDAARNEEVLGMADMPEASFDSIAETAVYASAQAMGLVDVARSYLMGDVVSKLMSAGVDTQSLQRGNVLDLANRLGNLSAELDGQLRVDERADWEYLQPGGDRDTRPLCLLLHPSLVEGIGLDGCKDLICLEPPMGVGNQDQVYARILRRLDPKVAACVGEGVVEQPMGTIHQYVASFNTEERVVSLVLLKDKLQEAGVDLAEYGIPLPDEITKGVENSASLKSFLHARAANWKRFGMKMTSLDQDREYNYVVNKDDVVTPDDIVLAENMAQTAEFEVMAQELSGKSFNGGVATEDADVRLGAKFCSPLYEQRAKCTLFLGIGTRGEEGRPLCGAVPLPTDEAAPDTSAPAAPLEDAYATEFVRRFAVPTPPAAPAAAVAAPPGGGLAREASNPMTAP